MSFIIAACNLIIAALLFLVTAAVVGVFAVTTFYGLIYQMVGSAILTVSTYMEKLFKWTFNSAMDFLPFNVKASVTVK